MASIWHGVEHIQCSLDEEVNTQSQYFEAIPSSLSSIDQRNLLGIGSGRQLVLVYAISNKTEGIDTSSLVWHFRNRRVDNAYAAPSAWTAIENRYIFFHCTTVHMVFGTLAICTVNAPRSFS